jgi:SAF domain-containing protein
VQRTVTETATGGAGPTTPGPGAPPVARPALQPVRTRRRPLLVGLGVALTAVGGLGAAWLASSGTGTIAVVGVAHEIHAGQVIHRQDLVSVQIVAGSGLSSLPVQRAEEAVGKRSLVRLLPGSLVNPSAIADKLVPAPGQALVGLSLGPGQHPAAPLDSGDSVAIVYTPGGQDQPTAGSEQPESVPAVLVSSHDDPDTGKTVVDVSVPVAAAAKVATWGSSGRATVALLSASQS